MNHEKDLREALEITIIALEYAHEEATNAKIFILAGLFKTALDHAKEVLNKSKLP